MSTTLLLDSDIRDWVVLPLFVIMIAAGLLRHYVGVVLKSDPQKTNVLQQRAQNVARHASKIRSGGSHYITTWQWQVRKHHYAKLLKEQADWLESEEAQELLLASQSGDGETNKDDPMAAMTNPLSMMKGNMVFMVQNMVMMQGIQHFFSGFILLKIPFPLTAGFKQMFHRGLFELPTLDPSYVSSVSWYFLVMFGLRSFFKLAIGDPTLEMREQGALQMKMGLSPPNPATTDGEAQAKLLRGEADNVEFFLAPHKSNFDQVEKRLLKSRYPKKASAYAGSAAKDDFLLGAAGVSRSTKSKKDKKS